MKVKTLTKLKTSIILFLVASLMAACSGGSMEGRILVSEVPQNGSFDMSPWNLAKVEGARIVAIMPGVNGDVKNLTVDFFSAISPSVSYNGENMLFAAKKEAGDHWQIYEMKLGSGKTKQLTFCETDCINPSYLPINRFGFTKRMNDEKLKECDMVFTANLDGSNQQQITFSPQTFAELTVLRDGRFVAMEKQIYPEEGKQKLMVMRPDGTKLEFFYKSGEGSCVRSKVVETDDEQILLVEKNTGGSNIVSLSYNLPLHSCKNLSAGKDGDFLSVANYLNDKILVTFKKSGGETFNLFEFDTVNGEMNELYKNDGFDVLEAVLVKAYERPKNLPSEIQLKEKAGLLMCQDINFYGIESVRDNHNKAKADKIEIIGIDSILGIVDVEEDGSFYIKVEADVPFRIQTLSADNEVVSGPGSWYYIRPNERRACVGCHTGPEIAPFNRQPLSVRKDPVIIKNNSELRLHSNTKDYEHED